MNKTFFFDKTWKQTSVLAEELQDYKVKIVLEIERLQDYICLKGRVPGLQERKDYKSLSKGEREGYLLSRVGTWTWELDL